MSKPQTYGVFHHALIILCVQIILRGKKLFFLFVIIIALFTNNFLCPKITCMSHKKHIYLSSIDFLYFHSGIYSEQLSSTKLDPLLPKILHGIALSGAGKSL